jgi:hypothetical protein
MARGRFGSELLGVCEDDALLASLAATKESWWGYDVLRSAIPTPMGCSFPFPSEP